MPMYSPFTPVADLPANGDGQVTILEAHLDAAHATLADVLERIGQAMFTAGGVVIPGAVTNPSAALVQVVGRMGITADARTFLAVADQSVDLASVPTSTRCLVVIRAAAGASANHQFVDAVTGESITHALMSAWGRLEVLQGDASNYPALSDDCVPVARVTKTGASTLTLDEILVEPPVARYSLTPRGTTAERPAAAPAARAQLYWDSDLGKLIAHDSAAWVNVDGSAL